MDATTARTAARIAEDTVNLLKGVFPLFRCPVDLHAPDMDPTGRLDVLCARTVKLVVDRMPDPMMKVWYGQFQEAVDAGIYHALHKHNMAKTMEKIGLAPKVHKPKAPRKPRKPRPARGDVGGKVDRKARARRYRRDDGGMGGAE